VIYRISLSCNLATPFMPEAASTPSTFSARCSVLWSIYFHSSDAAGARTRRKADENTMSRKKLCSLISLLAIFVIGCKSITGTYTDANGAVILELRSGGNASLTFMGDVENCSYTSSGEQVTLTCKGSPVPTTVFNIHDDGSLTGPPGSFMPPLRKK
jgi:hypothetical protein